MAVYPIAASPAALILPRSGQSHLDFELSMVTGLKEHGCHSLRKRSGGTRLVSGHDLQSCRKEQEERRALQAAEKLDVFEGARLRSLRKNSDGPRFVSGHDLQSCRMEQEKRRPLQAAEELDVLKGHDFTACGKTLTGRALYQGTALSRAVRWREKRIGFSRCEMILG